MKRLKQTHEIEENEYTKRGSHNPNQREFTEEDNDKDMLSDLPDCILLHILSFLKHKDAVATCLLSTRWEHLRRSLPTKDTLSNLPDSVLLHILSFLNIKTATQTRLFSTRWKYLWRRLPINSSDFNTSKGFIKFLDWSMFIHNSMPLNTLDLECQSDLTPHLVKRIVRYAVSHNINRLRIHCRSYYNHHEYPPSLFSCQSLTSLDLGHPYIHVLFPNSLNLPSLTYLKLDHFFFCNGNDGHVEPFSTINRLKTLILHNFKVQDEKPLCISSTTLLNLSIHTGYRRYSNILLFAPSLCTFSFTGNPFDKLTGSHISSIRQVTIDIRYDIFVETSFGLLDWLREITNIKSLTVTPRTLQALSLIPDILKLKLPFLCNMKSLQLNFSCDLFGFSASSWRDIKMELAGDKSWKENAKLPVAIKARLEPEYSSIFDEMIGFLLQNSPSAKVDIIKFPL